MRLSGGGGTRKLRRLTARRSPSTKISIYPSPGMYTNESHQKIQGNVVLNWYRHRPLKLVALSSNNPEIFSQSTPIRHVSIHAPSKHRQRIT
eukprot:753474-Hanusia_phi.AAC.2